MTIFANLIARKPKAPPEAVDILKEVLVKVKSGEALTEKSVNEISKAFSNVKWLLFGDEKHEPVQDDAMQVARLSCKHGLVPLLIETLRVLPFENRKEAAMVFGSVVRMHMMDDTCPGAAEVLRRAEDLVGFLIDGYGDNSIALICGQMLRDTTKEPKVAEVVLNAPMFYRLFNYLDAENFEIASDAYSTLRELLTRLDADENSVVPRFLVNHYDEFVEAYHHTLDTGNYVTKRQCLKLLGEMLANKSNKAFADRYVSDETNLMKAMQRLRDETRGIQFEAFHVFKAFALSPARGKTVAAMLYANKDKLVKFFSDFHNDKDGQDEVFAHERSLVIHAIATLDLSQCTGRLSRDHSRKNGLTSSASQHRRLNDAGEEQMHSVARALDRQGEAASSPRAHDAGRPKDAQADVSVGGPGVGVAQEGALRDSSGASCAVQKMGSLQLDQSDAAAC